MAVNRNSRRLAAVAALVLVPVMSGCATGLDAQTTQDYQVTDSVDVTHNTVDIRNMFVLGPVPGQTLTAGSATPLYLSLINNSATQDRLMAIAAPEVAGSVPIPGGGIEMPPRQLVSPGRQGAPIIFQGLTGQLRGGEWRRLVLSFQRAGMVTVTVPVVPRQGPYATYAPAPVPVTPGPGRPGSGKPGTEKPGRPGQGGPSGEEPGQSGERGGSGNPGTGGGSDAPGASPRPTATGH